MEDEGKNAVSHTNEWWHSLSAIDIIPQIKWDPIATELVHKDA